MASQPRTLDVVEPPLVAARRIAPLAAASAARAERDRALAPELVSELVDAGLLRLGVARSFGGREADAGELLETIEELARADASTGWCVMIAATSGLMSAYLAPDEAMAVYGDPRSVSAGVFAPCGRAQRRDGGFVVGGRWSLVSGISHSNWVTAGCVVYDGDEPSLLGPEAPDVRLVLLPTAALEVIDTWTASGLCATGSHDVAVGEEPVAAGRAVSLVSDRPVLDGALYAFPLFGLLALGIAAVALGVARAAIDDFIELAAEKRPVGSARPLADRSGVQRDLAEAEAALRAARAHVQLATDAAWRAACEQAALDLERRVDLRLAATHATRTSAAVVDVVYNAAGASAIYASSPLQRRFRDVHVATQHMMVSAQAVELTGRVLLGLSANTAQL